MKYIITTLLSLLSMSVNGRTDLNYIPENLINLSPNDAHGILDSTMGGDFVAVYLRNGKITEPLDGDKVVVHKFSVIEKKWLHFQDVHIDVMPANITDIIRMNVEMNDKHLAVVWEGMGKATQGIFKTTTIVNDMYQLDDARNWVQTHQLTLRDPFEDVELREPRRRMVFYDDDHFMFGHPHGECDGAGENCGIIEFWEYANDEWTIQKELHGPPGTQIGLNLALCGNYLYAPSLALDSHINVFKRSNSSVLDFTLDGTIPVNVEVMGIACSGDLMWFSSSAGDLVRMYKAGHYSEPAKNIPVPDENRNQGDMVWGYDVGTHDDKLIIAALRYMDEGKQVDGFFEYYFNDTHVELDGNYDLAENSLGFFGVNQKNGFVKTTDNFKKLNMYAILPPTPQPTKSPTHRPTHRPTHSPTHSPTHHPTSPAPTDSPTHSPTHSPTTSPPAVNHNVLVFSLVGAGAALTVIVIGIVVYRKNKKGYSSV